MHDQVRHDQARLGAASPRPRFDDSPELLPDSNPLHHGTLAGRASYRWTNAAGRQPEASSSGGAGQSPESAERARTRDVHGDPALRAQLALGLSPRQALVTLGRPATRAALRRTRRIAASLRPACLTRNVAARLLVPAEPSMWVCETAAIDAFVCDSAAQAVGPVYMTLVVDTYSRAVLEAGVSAGTPSSTALITLIRAAAARRTADGVRRGLPAYLELWDASTTAREIAAAVKARFPSLRVTLPSPWRPRHRGMVERVFRALAPRPDGDAGRNAP